ncbi:glycosyltransferase [Campylobacter hyointestinalis]|uniref:glycosyltransferase n=1 Tax=Campylobacter hyointestinalis TaxID=198 RepID=UPI000CE50376|nr:glycosyltransferase [Campylobacter hyointestinalis]PPB76496.1 hypothetical protein CDQ81_07075 [Campylobacter hyointestinalis subsp. hyointestinalis]
MTNYNKNLAIFIENYAAGGSDKIARNLVDYLHYNRLFLFVNRENDTSVLLKEQLPSNVELIYYNFITIARLGKMANSFLTKCKIFYILFKAFNLLIRYPLIIASIIYFYFLFRKYEIDTLFINNGGYPGGEYCRSATISFRLIILLHSNTMNCMIYHIVHSIATRPFFILFTPIEYFYDYLVDKSCKFIVVSNETKEALISKRRIKQEPLVIFNGVLKLNYNKKIVNFGTLNLLNIGVIYTIKNQLKLLKSIKLAIEMGAVDIRLYIVGKEAEIEYIEKLKKYIRDNSLENIIFFEGFQDTYKYYEMCDIFVLTSDVESFALVRTEAMNAYMPVITTNVGDADVQIQNGKSGFIVDNIEDIAKKILYYYQNREIIVSHGENAYKIFNEKFKIDKMIKKYQDLIDGGSR